MELTDKFSEVSSGAHIDMSYPLPTASQVDSALNSGSVSSALLSNLDSSENAIEATVPNMLHVVDTDVRPSELSINISDVIENLPEASPIAQALIGSGLVDVNLHPFRDKWGVSAEGNIHVDTQITFVPDTDGILKNGEVYRVDTSTSAVIDTHAIRTSNPMSLKEDGLLSGDDLVLPGFVHTAEISDIYVNSKTLDNIKNSIASDGNNVKETIAEQQETDSSWLPDLSPFDVDVAPSGDYAVRTDAHITISTSIIVPPEVAQHLKGSLDGNIGSADISYNVSVRNDGVDGNDNLQVSVDTGALEINTTMKAFEVASVVSQLQDQQDKFDRIDKVSAMLDNEDPKLMEMLSEAKNSGKAGEEFKREFVAYVDSSPDMALPGEETMMASLPSVKSTFNNHAVADGTPEPEGNAPAPDDDQPSIQVAYNDGFGL